MKLMYRTTRWGIDITQYEVSKETPKTVTFVQRYSGKFIEATERKEADNHRWFDTWEEAYGFLVERCKSKVDFTRRQLEIDRKLLKQVKEKINPYK